MTANGPEQDNCLIVSAILWYESGKFETRQGMSGPLDVIQDAVKPWFRGSSVELTYSSPRGPIADTCVMYSPDFAQ